LKDQAPVIVGTIGAPHGVRGWVRINSFTEPADNLFAYPLLMAHGNGWQPVEIEQVQQRGAGFIAKIVGIEDRDQAALITNLKLAVLREDLPDLEDENYWTDVIGLEVYNEAGILLGKVDDIFETGANAVLVVKNVGTGKEHLIPYVPDMYVQEIDIPAGTMRVTWDPEF
jgi:16S rRNA processing protein RimM